MRHGAMRVETGPVGGEKRKLLGVALEVAG